MKLRRLITRRACVRLALLLVVGAIVNVAVAWGCALLVHSDDLPVQIGREAGGESQNDHLAKYRDWKVRTSSSRVSSRAESRWNDIDVIDRSSPFPEPNPTGLPATLLPKWCGFIKPPSVPTTTKMRHDRAAEAWGWPTLAVYAKWSSDVKRFSAKYEIELVAGLGPVLVTRDTFGASYQYPQALPIVPLWPGFAINTVFYAAILWILCAVPFVLRRRMRVKRGLCPKCAYDLRGRAISSTVCPECGAANLPSPSLLVRGRGVGGEGASG